MSNIICVTGEDFAVFDTQGNLVLPSGESGHNGLAEAGVGPVEPSMHSEASSTMGTLMAGKKLTDMLSNVLMLELVGIVTFVHKLFSFLVQK